MLCGRVHQETDGGGGGGGDTAPFDPSKVNVIECSMPSSLAQGENATLEATVENNNETRALTDIIWRTADGTNVQRVEDISILPGTQQYHDSEVSWERLNNLVGPGEYSVNAVAENSVEFTSRWKRLLHRGGPRANLGQSGHERRSITQSQSASDVYITDCDAPNTVDGPPIPVSVTMRNETDTYAECIVEWTGGMTRLTVRTAIAEAGTTTTTEFDLDFNVLATGTDIAVVKKSVHWGGV